MSSCNDCVVLALRARELTDDEIRALDLSALSSFGPKLDGYAVELREVTESRGDPGALEAFYAALDRAAARRAGACDG